MKPREKDPRRLSPVARLVLGVALIGAVSLSAYYGLASFDRRQHPPPCTGLGGGCEPTASAATGIIAIIAIGPAAVAILVIGYLLERMARTQRARTLLINGMLAAFALFCTVAAAFW
jgi:hypothetical protein